VRESEDEALHTQPIENFLWTPMYENVQKTRKPCCRKETARCRSCSFRFYRAMHVVLARYCYRNVVRPSVCPSVSDVDVR